MKQQEILEEILANIHLNYPNEAVLMELMYTASETGILDVNTDPEDIETIVKIFQLAIGYGDKVPEELRM